MDYDNYEPFVRLKLFDFCFESSHYKIWQDGNLIKSQKSHADIISINSIKYDESKFCVVTINSTIDKDILAEVIEFDMFVSLNDRLQLLLLPANDQINQCVGITASKMVFDSTRDTYDIPSNKPYACNFFSQNGDIKKITLSFNYPEKLIEFY